MALYRVSSHVLVFSRKRKVAVVDPKAITVYPNVQEFPSRMGPALTVADVRPDIYISWDAQYTDLDELALIKLEKPVRFNGWEGGHSDGYDVRPICTPDLGDSEFRGATANGCVAYRFVAPEDGKLLKFTSKKFLVLYWLNFVSGKSAHTFFPVQSEADWLDTAFFKDPCKIENGIPKDEYV